MDPANESKDAQGETRIELVDPAAYRRRLFERVGERDPVSILEETPAALAALVRGVETDELRRCPAPGKWSVLEVIGHLVDTEWVFGHRARAILSDERPAIVGIDQDRWVAKLAHGDADPTRLLEDFTTLRTLNARFWRSVDAADLDRVGLHDERGEEALGTMLRMCAGHDLHHLEQIGRMLDAKF